MHRLVATIYWLALIAWLAALLAGGATATSAFTALPKLGVMVPSAALVLPVADEAAGRYAAGFVAQPVFTLAERLSLVAMPVIAVALIVQAKVFRWPHASWSNRLRVASLAVAIVLMTLHVVVLAPRMTVALDAYRTAIQDGNAELAGVEKAAFDRDHVRANALLRSTLVLLVAGVALSAWTLTPSRPAGRGRGDMQAPRLWGR